MSKSTNKTSAALERLVKYGRLIIEHDAGNGWIVFVAVFPSVFDRVNIACVGKTIDEALNEAVRRLDGENRFISPASGV